jgi:toxin ParE1/3/4
VARIVWADSALEDLDEIAEYIALDDESAAKRLVRRVFDAIERLRDLPDSGRRPPELGRTRYRELIVGPCRLFYRHSDGRVYALYVMRSERELRNFILTDRDGGS